MMNKKFLTLCSFVLLLVCSLCFVACEEDETTDGTGKSVNLTRDLVLYYTFDEGPSADATQVVEDHSGKRCNGIISGTGNHEFVADTPGQSGGYALKLRKGDYVNIPTYACPDSLNVTVNLWIKDFGQGMLFASLDGNNFSTPTMYINNSDNVNYQYGGNSYAYTVGFSTSLMGLQSGGWHMLTVAAANSTGMIKFYIDGILVDTQAGSQRKCIGTKMQIGGNADGHYSVLADPMIIDNCRVYQRCLNEKEVAKLYSEEKK